MSDVMCWVVPKGDEYSSLNSLLHGSPHYTDQLRLIIAEELKLESADKVDGSAHHPAGCQLQQAGGVARARLSGVLQRNHS